MFGSIGMPELIIILMIALIIFGPRKLPELGRSLGKSLGEFKRASNELRNTLDEEIRVEEQRVQRAASGRRRAGATVGTATAADLTDEPHTDRPFRARPAARRPQWRSFRSPRAASAAPVRDDDDPLDRTDRPRRARARRRPDVVSGASRRAPETADRRRSSASSSAACIAFFFLDSCICRSSCEPMRQMLPGRQQAHLHASRPKSSCSGMKIGAASPACSSRCRHRAYQVWLFIAPGLYSHEKKFAIPFVLFVVDVLLRRRGVLALHRVPVHWKFFVSFNPSYRAVPAEASTRRSRSTSRCCWPWRRSSRCRRWSSSSRGWAWSRRVPAAQLQVRGADHRHPRRRPQPGHRHRLADDDGRADARALHPQHRHRVGLPEAEAGSRRRLVQDQSESLDSRIGIQQRSASNRRWIKTTPTCPLLVEALGGDDDVGAKRRSRA